ncbi:MAG: sigma-70 family RNA polymerase sigma factor [Vampirovibrionales bacterium]
MMLSRIQDTHDTLETSLSRSDIVRGKVTQGTTQPTPEALQLVKHRGRPKQSMPQEEVSPSQRPLASLRKGTVRQQEARSEVETIKVGLPASRKPKSTQAHPVEEATPKPRGKKPKYHIEDKSNLKSYVQLVEKVAQVEYYRVPQHMIDLEELVTTGLMAIQNLIQGKSPEQLNKLNTSYLATATRWAIRNELRSRFRWYTMQTSWQQEEFEPEESATSEASTSEDDTATVRPMVSGAKRPYYTNILSIDGIADSGEGDTPYDFIKDHSFTPDEDLENTELIKSIKKAIQDLPPKERTIVEYRFYRNMQVKDIASMIGLSSSRITRIVQGAIETIRQTLKAQHQLA